MIARVLLGETIMSKVLRHFWADDHGAVISTELILVVSILIFGVIAGLVALRNSIIASFGNIGDTLVELVPSFTYSGFLIGAADGGTNIALVNGYFAGTLVTPLTGLSIPPLAFPFTPIPPAP
jgi:Flp pilus assembly pilin Flp